MNGNNIQSEYRRPSFGKKFKEEHHEDTEMSAVSSSATQPPQSKKQN